MVIDSSSLISLARSGLLPLLALLPVEPVIVDVVEAESVSDGLAGGHADAAAIEATIAPFPRHTSAGTRPPDAAVLDAARQVGTLVANDLALGRRARNLGARWLRTADVVVLLRRTGQIDRAQATGAIAALRDTGRVGVDLAADYLAELE